MKKEACADSTIEAASKRLKYLSRSYMLENSSTHAIHVDKSI
jgi:hypothetical protein